MSTQNYYKIGQYFVLLILYKIHKILSDFEWLSLFFIMFQAFEKM